MSSESGLRNNQCAWCGRPVEDPEDDLQLGEAVWCGSECKYQSTGVA